jgi:hypothetical protein
MLSTASTASASSSISWSASLGCNRTPCFVGLVFAARQLSLQRTTTHRRPGLRSPPAVMGCLGDVDADVDPEAEVVTPIDQGDAEDPPTLGERDPLDRNGGGLAGQTWVYRYEFLHRGPDRPRGDKDRREEAGGEN